MKNYEGDWIGLGKVLLPKGLFNFGLRPNNTQSVLLAQTHASFSMAVEPLARGQAPSMLKNDETPAGPGINVWIETRGGTPEQVFARVSEWVDRRVVFVRQEHIAGNLFLHGQTTQQGADDGSISEITRHTDFRIDHYILSLPDGNHLVVRASREIAMHAELKARRERDAKDTEKNPPRHMNFDQDSLDAESRYQAWRDKLNPLLEAALPLVMANIRVFQGDPAKLPLPAKGMARHYLWNCAFDYPMDKLAINGARIFAEVDFGTAGRAVWLFEDVRVTHEDGRPVNMRLLDAAIEKNTAGLWQEKREQKAFDPEFEEIKARPMRVGGHEGVFSEFYLPANRIADDTLADRNYAHYAVLTYADGQQWVSNAELTRAQMRMFRASAMRSNYLDLFLAQIRVTGLPS